jgi:hypothetical protein
MTETIAAKSDQLSADDLMGRDLTITVSKVSVSPRDEQPATLHFEGDGGKPYKPCKSMRRVLVSIWGPDASKYVGRSMVLYRDPDVQFGGLQVGGIRIRAMSHLEKRRPLALTATRGRKAAYVVEPLRDAPKQDKAADGTRDLVKRIQDADTAETLEAITGDPAVVKQRAWLASNRPELAEQLNEAVSAALGLLVTDEDHGDAYEGDAA